MSPTPTELKPKSEVIYRCSRCPWQRSLATDSDELRRELVHPLYGKVTVEELAKLDILNHSCRFYRLAAERVKNGGRR